MKQEINSTRASIELTLGFVIVLFGLVASTARLWSIGGYAFLPSGSYALVPGSVLMLIGSWRLGWKPWRATPEPHAATFGLILVLVSDWMWRGYNFFPSSLARGDIIIAAILLWFTSPAARARLVFLLAPATAILLAICFFMASGGRLLFSDDHASFIFRLSMLREMFPSIPFYYPGWNGGLDARDFFATGSLNAFLLFAPLVYLSDLRETYNIIIAAILFGVFPASVWLAGRRLSLPPPAPEISVILALSSGLVWYRWALKYGTVGFITSAALLPLVVTLGIRLFDRDHPPSLRSCALFVILCSLVFLWSASALILVPIGLWAVTVIVSRLIRRQTPAIPAHLAIICCALLIIHLPWVSLFWKVSNVGKFVGAAAPSTYSFEKAVEESGVIQEAAPAAAQGGDMQHRGTRHKAGELDIAQSIRVFREKMLATNPLILFFGFLGLCVLAHGFRTPLALLCVWLLALGTIAVPLKPQLELDRMLLVLSNMLCFPAAALLQKLLLYADSGRVHRALSSLAFGFLCVSPLSMSAMLSNRTIDQFHFASPLVSEMARAIRELGGDGRVLFAGCIVHELDEGHLAPLSIWSEKPLVASSPFHTLWRYTEVIPPSFLERGAAGAEEYYDLMNVSAVIAHDPDRRAYFSSRPEQYELVWREGRFSLFRRLKQGLSYFYEGHGEVLAQDTDSITVRIDSPSAVLKFNHFSFLQSSACQLQARVIAPEISFIALTNCEPGTVATIKAGSPLGRLLK